MFYYDQPQIWKMMYNLSRISVKEASSFTRLFKRILELFYLRGSSCFYYRETLKNMPLNVQFRLKRDLFDEPTKATVIVLGTSDNLTMDPILQH